MIPETCKKRVRTGWCLLLLLAALTLRLSLTPRALPQLRSAVQTVVTDPALWRAALFLELGVTPKQISAPETSPPETETPKASTAGDAALGVPPYNAGGMKNERGVEAPPPTAEATEAPALPQEPLFFASEAQALRLRGNCSYKPDLAALLLAPTELNADTTVLIVHTHTSEAYTPSPGCEYEPSGDYRTLEPAHSVVAVGEALADALRERGVRVIHDTSCNDYPSYNSSYANARARIEAQLREHPEIGMVLDIHRDALAVPVREEAELRGEVCAPMMLVVGTDEGGLEHPHWQQNLSCALKLQTLLCRSFPGLMKPLSLRRERFNGDLTPASLLVEVGSTENTLPEAQLAVTALAEAVSALLGAG